MNNAIIKHIKHAVWLLVVILPFIPSCLAEMQDIEAVEEYAYFYNRMIRPGDSILVFYDDYADSEYPKPSVRVKTLDGIEDSMIVDYYRFENANVERLLYERGYELISPFIYFVPYEVEWNYMIQDNTELRTRNFEL
mgnify:CR=1 FL=1